MIILSFVISTIYPFVQYSFFESIVEAVNLNYFIAVLTIFSFIGSKFDRFKFVLLLILPVALVFRHWLMLWTVIATSYQLCVLKLPIRNLAKIALALTFMELFVQSELVLMQIISHDCEFVSKTGRLVYDLGLGNSNNVGTTVFYLVALLYLVFGLHHKIFFVASSLLFTVGMFLYCGSRTFFIGCLLIILLAIFDYFHMIRKWQRLLVGCMPIMLTTMVLCLALNYMDIDVDFLNDLLTGRIYLFYIFFKDFTMNDYLLGKPMEFDLPLDNTYLAMLHLGGVFFVIFFCVCFFIVLVHFFDKIRPFIPFLIAVLIVSSTESVFAGISALSLIFWMITLIPVASKKEIFCSDLIKI